MDINNLPMVTIGCPITNRKYLIQRYLKHIYDLDYPKDKIKLYFVLNNCTDMTDYDLIDFKKKHENEYASIALDKYKIFGKRDKRLAIYRNDIYKKLVELRNYLLSKIDTDYFFSVDSDIMLTSNSLIELLKAEKDIIACVINNDRVLQPYKEYPKIRTNLLLHRKLMNGDDDIVHYYNFPLNEIVEVDYTGAVYLMKKEVCENVKYDFSGYGEDIPFCAMAKEKGYKIYAHTGLWQTHIMCEYQNYCIENKCKNPCVKVGKGNLVYQYKYTDNTIMPDLVRCAKLIKGDKPLLNNENKYMEKMED